MRKKKKPQNGFNKEVNSEADALWSECIGLLGITHLNAELAMAWCDTCIEQLDEDMRQLERAGYIWRDISDEIEYRRRQ